jgi:predicted transcriptional regulator
MCCSQTGRTLSWGKRATRTTEAAALLASLVTLLGLMACTKHAALGPVGSSSISAPVHANGDVLTFSFDSLDDRPVNSSTLRGKPAVLAFVASDDLVSQAQVGFLASMAKNDGDRVAYVLVAVEAPDRRELVQGFRSFFESKFGVSFRTGMADTDLLAGRGPFGDVRRLTVIVLDAGGRVVWQKTGLAKPPEIRAVLPGH